MRKAMLQLYGVHLSEDGKAVDYEAMGADPAFQRFVVATGELQGVDPSSLTREEKMAFFLNVYNVLVVHALVAFGSSHLKNTFSRSVC